MHGSDEEVDEPPETDSDEDLSDEQKHLYLYSIAHLYLYSKHLLG